MKNQELIKSSSLYYLGIETGGTTCKVGIVKDTNYSQIYRQQVFKTKMPEETIKSICDYINEQPETFSSIGIAAFGPLCLEKSSPEFGYITSTPKAEW